MTAKGRWWALAAVSLATLMTYLDNNVINVAIPTIQRDLHLSVTGLEWIVSSYLLVLAGLLLVGGRLADVYGRRRVFLTGLAIYKPVQVAWLTGMLGGYELARAEHFALTCGYVLFFLVHIAQVIRAGWNNFRAMLIGVELTHDEDPSYDEFRIKRIGLAAEASGTAGSLGVPVASSEGERCEAAVFLVGGCRRRIFGSGGF